MAFGEGQRLSLCTSPPAHNGPSITSKGLHRNQREKILKRSHCCYLEMPKKLMSTNQVINLIIGMFVPDQYPNHCSGPFVGSISLDHVMARRVRVEGRNLCCLQGPTGISGQGSLREQPFHRHSRPRPCPPSPRRGEVMDLSTMQDLSERTLLEANWVNCHKRQKKNNRIH